MKLIPSVLLISFVLLLASAGTWATYSDSAISSINTLTAGTMDLFLTDGTENANAQWTMVGGAPGDSANGGDIRIHNLGSVEANHVELKFILEKYEDNNGNLGDGCISGPESDTDLSGPGDMAKDIVVDNLKYSVFNGGVVSKEIKLVYTSGKTYHYDHTYLSDTNGNGFIDLEDLSTTTFDNLPAPKALNRDKPNYNDYTQLDMALSFLDNEDPSNPQNYCQGDIINMIVEVTLNQDASQ